MQESQFSLKSLNLNELPVFASNFQNIDLSLKPFHRSVAVILIPSKVKFVVYDRFDGLLRLPGGHLEDSEDLIQTAIRETQEEVGLKGLEFQKYLGSCHLFYNRNGLVSYCLEHYFWFNCNYQNWVQKNLDETGMRSILANKKEILSVQKFVQYPWLMNAFVKARGDFFKDSYQPTKLKSSLI